MYNKWYALRWRVLSRDNFTCQYCGQRAPDVILHVDHKIPRSAGGEDIESNCITSCAACNVGKNISHLIPKDEEIKSKKPNNFMSNIIIEYLTEHKEATTNEISKDTGIHRTTVSTFLNHCGLIEKSTKKGRHILYRLK